MTPNQITSNLHILGFTKYFLIKIIIFLTKNLRRTSNKNSSNVIVMKKLKFISINKVNSKVSLNLF